MSSYFVNALSARLGGGKTYILNLLTNLPDDNLKIYLVCPDKNLVPDDPRVIYVESPIANKNIIFRAFWEALYLPFILMRLNISVLFVPGGMDFTFFTNGIPKVTMFRNMLPFDSGAIDHLPSVKLRIKNWVLKHLMSRTMSTADHVVFISNYAKKMIENHVDIKSSNVIYHGISDAFFPTEKSYIEKEYILYVSRFEPYKNHLNLIVAYNRLDEVYKKKYNLVLIGELMKPSFSECMDYINKNNLSNSVIVKGKIPYESLPKLYQRAVLFVFPSSCENCPNILLEAIGCGVPVIASKTEPMPEFAQDAGLYFNEKCHEDIRQCLTDVLSKPDLLSSMKKKSILLRNNYMWKNTALKTWGCLKAIGDGSVYK
jgi:glycosyltransferase involved in cell wall biosynthesis